MLSAGGTGDVSGAYSALAGYAPLALNCSTAGEESFGLFTPDNELFAVPDDDSVEGADEGVTLDVKARERLQRGGVPSRKTAGRKRTGIILFMAKGRPRHRRKVHAAGSGQTGCGHMAGGMKKTPAESSVICRDQYPGEYA